MKVTEQVLGRGRTWALRLVFLVLVAAGVGAVWLMLKRGAEAPTEAVALPGAAARGN